jgi:hypothetical protein
VTEDCPIAAVEEGGDQAAIERQGRMSKRVDVGMNPMKAAGLPPPGDGGAGQTAISELAGAQDAVLALRHSHKTFCVEFVSLSETNLTQIGHAADSRCPNVTEGL